MTEQQAEPQEHEPDRPDMRDPTNGAPLLQGQSSTTGLGGAGNETTGGGVGPDLAGGAASEEATASSPWMNKPGSGGDAGTSGAGSNDAEDGDDETTANRKR